MTYRAPDRAKPERYKTPITAKFSKTAGLPYSVTINDTTTGIEVFNVEWDADRNMIVVAYKAGAWEKGLRPSKAS